MENPTEKKRFPWIWVAVGCAVVAVAVLAVVVAAAIAFVAVPAIRTTLANQNPAQAPLPTALVNQSPTATPFPTPQANPTAIPKPGSGGGTTIGNLPFQFSTIQNPADLNSPSLMDEMVTALNLNTNTDFMAPKTYTGTITLDPSTPFTLGNGWCAKDPSTLQQNMADMQFQLSINDTPIDLSQYPSFTVTDNQGNACAITGILITPNNNLSGTFHIILTQKFLKSLDDGITSSPYPAGDIIFDFTVRFGTNSGNDT